MADIYKQRSDTANDGKHSNRSRYGLVEVVDVVLVLLVTDNDPHIFALIFLIHY